jgi:hypothetical protein
VKYKSCYTMNHCFTSLRLSYCKYLKNPDSRNTEYHTVLLFNPLNKGKLRISLPITDKQLYCDLHVRPCSGKIKYSVYAWNTMYTHTHCKILNAILSLLLPYTPSWHDINYAEIKSSFILPLI